MTSYTVVMDAVTIATGRRDPQTHALEVVRLQKGDPIEAPDEHPSIMTLLSAKAIRLTADVTGKEKVTPRHVFRVYKDAQDNPAGTAEITTDSVPLPAPEPITDPNDL